jgi:lysozyme family protein
MSMADFDQACTRVLGSEGGYSDRGADRGGPTRWGITEKLARAKGYTGDMKDFPLESAKAVYLVDFWSVCKLGDLPDQKEAEDLFQMAVNSGPTFEKAALAATAAIDPETARLFVAQMRHFAEICNGHPDQIANLHGWLNRALAYV